MTTRAGTLSFGQSASLLGKSEVKFGALIELHTAHFRLHQVRENSVEKIQQRFTAAEIVAERNDLSFVATAPARLIRLKNPGIGETETIDALLHVTDEEAIARLAADRANDRVLRRVDVLTLIHKNVME